MNSKTPVTHSRIIDILLWTVIAVLMAMGVIVNFYLSDIYSTEIRLVGWVVLAAILLGMALMTHFGKVSWQFLQEARMEMRKVTWPTRQETGQTTLVVAAMVVIVALFLWGIDTILLWGIGLIAGNVG